MSDRHDPRSLMLLARLREREVDALRTGLAEKRRLGQRYERNIAALETLCQSSGASGGHSPALAMNCANYKDSLLKVRQSQMQELALHRMDEAASQARLLEAELKRRGIDTALEQVRERQRLAVQRSEQKVLDDMAGQVWLRGRS